MFTVTITEKGGDQKRLEFDKDEITIGRLQDNDISLAKGNVSKHHSRIVLKSGQFVIYDMKSTNGTYVNGRKITGPQVLKGSDKVYIGDFIIAVEDLAPEAEESASPGEMLGEAPGARRAPPPPPARGGARAVAAAPDHDDDDEEEDSDVLDVSGLHEEPDEVEELDEEEDDDVLRPAPRAAAPGAARGAASAAAAATGRRSDPAPRASSVALHEAAQPMVPAGREGGGSAGLGAAAAAAREPARREPVPTPIRELRVPVPTPVAGTPAMAQAPARGPAPPAGAAPSQAGRAARLAKRQEVQRTALDKLTTQLDLARVDPARLGDEELWRKGERFLSDVVEQLETSGTLGGVDAGSLVQIVLHEALGLGPFDDLLADEEVEEIHVLRPDRILVARRGGRPEETSHVFAGDASLRSILRRMLAPAGRAGAIQEPFVDAQLPDGVRVTAVLSPAAPYGSSCLVTRVAREAPVAGLAELRTRGFVTGAGADWLARAVAGGRTIAISGKGPERSNLVAALAAAFPGEARVVSVEEVADLRLGNERWVALQMPEGAGGAEERRESELRRMLTAARRLRPDRTVFGSLRPEDALAVLDAVSGAPSGTLLVLDGDSPRDALLRLERAARRRAGDGSTQAVRELVAQNVPVVAHVGRSAQGDAKVTQVAEVAGTDSQGYMLRDVPL